MSHAIEEHNSTDKTIFGFWVYLMTDCILFASLFATYIVLWGGISIGHGEESLFSLPFILVETLVLLTSSFTCGLVVLALRAKALSQIILWLGVTFALGAVFLGMELYEFSHLIKEGYDWTKSGYLSAYFTLVGTHGLHIAVGLLWIAVLVLQLLKKGVTTITNKRLLMLSLFWHFLDIIWIFIFSIVYLLGAI